MEQKTNLTFGQALEALKAGKKVCREGWNGKGMWLIYTELGEFQKKDNNNEYLSLLPFIVMKTADNNFVPWLASQTDMLSEDWCILD